MKKCNGAFGVGRPDKVTEKGEPVLRLIMDLRATNYCMKQIDGEVGHLCGAASFQRVVIESGQELLVSGEDLTAAFYLFRLPEEWSNYMVLEKPVARSELGLAGDGETLLGISVLPMGWHSAVGLMQACHRAIALRTTGSIFAFRSNCASGKSASSNNISSASASETVTTSPPCAIIAKISSIIENKHLLNCRMCTALPA